MRANLWRLVDYKELDSTNDEAVRLSATENNLIITTEVQTKGKGRLGRVWKSFNGNLFMSMLFSWPLAENNALVLIVGLSLHKTIKNFLPDIEVKIKWPNDILVNGKKISGILLERCENEKIVVGIGVNITQHPASSECVYHTTSLLENGVNINRMDFMRLFLNNFEIFCSVYAEKGIYRLTEMWQKEAKGIGEKIVVRQPQKEECGIFRKINDKGELVLDIEGTIKTINAGDVFFDKKED